MQPESLWDTYAKSLIYNPDFPFRPTLTKKNSLNLETCWENDQNAQRHRQPWNESTSQKPNHEKSMPINRECFPVYETIDIAYTGQ